MDGTMIKVGMADANICHSPDVITTLGLGSCVGVALYDKTTKIAGLVHVMLPDSTKVRQNQNKAYRYDAKGRGKQVFTDGKDRRRSPDVCIWQQ